VGSVHNEVVGPDMVPVLRATTHARPIIQPQATAFRRIALSDACSATSFFSRAFSRSRSLSFLAWDTCMPLYSLRQR
jgi:hypothetical protein